MAASCANIDDACDYGGGYGARVGVGYRNNGTMRRHVAGMRRDFASEGALKQDGRR